MGDAVPADFDPDQEATGPGVFGLPTTAEDATLLLLPVPWAATVSYRRGTDRAPEAIRLASRQVELFDLELGSPYQAGIAMLEPDEQILVLCQQGEAARESGDPQAVDRFACELHRRAGEIAVSRLEQGKIIAVIGGEHGTGLGAMRAAAAGEAEFGLLQVDAHADLRDRFQHCRYSHAAWASRALEECPTLTSLVQVGVRDCSKSEADRVREDPRIRSFGDRQLDSDVLTQICERLPPAVWVSFDIDGLDPSLCPNTGTPVPGGLCWREATALLRTLAESGRRIVGFDLCEVVPEGGERSPGEGWDEIVAARLLYKLCGYALRTQN